MLPIDIDIVKMEVVNGRAEIEIALPVCSDREENGGLEIYLWEAGALSSKQRVNMQLSSNSAISVQPAFYSVYPLGDDEECVIKIIQPHLWEGLDKPYIYHLEIYKVEDSAPFRELVCDRFIAIRTFAYISGKGYLLNGVSFLPRCVYYENIHNIFSCAEQILWEGIMQKLRILAQMGANILFLGSGDGMSKEELVILQKYCDRVGVFLYIRALSGEGFGSAKVMREDLENMVNAKNDNYVAGVALFKSPGLPTNIYYRCRALWSREPFVYIDSESLYRQADGGYTLKVYTSCKKVTLMINDKVFGVCEDTGEVLFQDLPIKGFPVNITALTEEHTMSVRFYGL